jgi:lycopene beta-cyclase
VSRFDYLIVGAGCAGLSLAVHLLEKGLGGRRIALLDPRTRFDRDRTWCYFAPVKNARHPFASSVSHAWSRWRVVCGGREVLRTSRAHRYEHIPADAFYRSALERLAENPRVELRLDTEVVRLLETETGVSADTSHGPVEAGIAFDSRPLPPATIGDHLRLLQHFAGYCIRAERPVFTPDVATLMDFDVDQERGIHFFYVLPYDERTALVETTYISEEPLDEAAYALDIERYLTGRYRLGSWEILSREHGAIPMTTEPMPTRARRIYWVGLAGGLAKPSTGYAFLAIQRFSAELAARLAHEEMPEPPVIRPSRTRFLDRVFLSYIHRFPERAPALLARLFEHVPPDVLVRFLSDAGSVADDLRVMAAMPALPLVAEAVRSRRRWMSR